MNQQELDDLEYITKMASDEFLSEYELVMKSRINELEAANFNLKNRIEVLEFHLNEIATSDLVASNLRCMAKHALNNKNG